MIGPGTIAGDYRIDGRLGAGGMGVVWKATHLRTGATAVLKSIAAAGLSPEEHADLRARLRREAKVLMSLDHEGIVRGRQILDIDGELAIVLDYVAGPTFDEWLAEPPPPALHRRLTVIRRIVEALTFAHAQGVVHRDLKPANVIVAPGDRPKLLDFGLAKALDSTKLTQTGVVMGTIAYMPPEQARGRPADHRADLFSVGMMLAEAIGLRLPFAGSDDPSCRYRALLSSDPIPIDDWVPDRVRDPLDELLAKDPQARTADGETLLRALREWEADPSFEEFVETARRVPPAQRRRTPRLARIPLPKVDAAVEQLLAGAGAGKGGAIAILSPPRAGRTWALREAADRLRIAGIETILVGGVEEGLSGLAAATLFASLAGPPKETDETFAVAASAPSPSEPRRVIGALDERLADGAPRCLAFDDVQYFAAEDLALLDVLLRTSREKALLLLFAGDAAPEGAGAARCAAFGDFLARAAGRRDLIRIALEPVEEETMTQAAAGCGLPAPLAADLGRLSGGRPGIAQALVERWFARQPLASILPDGPPDLVRRLRARFELLERPSRETVRMLVDSGGEADASDLARAAGIPRLALAARLRDLQRKHGWIRQEGERVFLTLPFLGAICKRNEAETGELPAALPG